MTGFILQISELWPKVGAKLGGLPGDVIKILLNPTESPRLTAIIALLAIAGLLLLSSFIELLLALLMPDKRKAAEGGGGNPTDEGVESAARPEKAHRKISRRRMVWFAGALLLTATVYGGSRPQFCGSCHEMAGAYSAWKDSRHSSAGCLACHQKPGLIGYAMAEADLVRMVSAKASGRHSKQPIRATVDDDACWGCHAQLAVKTVVSKSIRVSHAEFLNSGYACSECHSSVAHSDATVYPRYPTMDKCAGCHDGKKAKATCSTCHAIDGATTLRRPKAEYPKAQLTSSNCGGCHATGKCTACHGLEMPHPEGWSTAGHAKAAAFEKKAICKKCHDNNFCGNCHHFPGHPADWKLGHRVSGSAEKACMSCHLADKSPVFCDLCHDPGERLVAPGNRPPAPVSPPNQQ